MTLMNSALRRLSLLALAVVASACSMTPATPPDSQASQWQLSGKIGLWMGDQQESASITWQHCSPASGRLRLSGPLGSGAIEIVQQPGQVTLRQGGDSRTADSAEQLALEAGWPIPVSALSFWVRGMAAPTSAQESQLSPQGQLRHLQQLGWEIDFNYGENQQLPNRLEAVTEDQKVVLLIREWMAAPEYCQQP